MTEDATRTALVITDPQNDFLSPEGATWELVGASVEKNRTVPNLEALLRTAKAEGIEVFVSPTTTTPPMTVGSLGAPWKT